jgi:hypothetical protein
LKSAVFHRNLSNHIRAELRGARIVKNISGAVSIPGIPFDYPVQGQRRPDKMQYLLMIYGNEQQWDKMNEAELSKVFGEYTEFSKSIAASGHYKGGNRLDFTSKATTVRVRDGKRLVTDGPFAETKEQLGGFFLVEAKDLDEALKLAERIPGARWGSIEVRPIIPVTMPS